MKSTDEQAAFQALKNKLADRNWRLNNLYFIKDKTGRKILFRLNWAQKSFLENLWYFNVLLKARQLGFTTLIMILYLDECLFNSNRSAGVIAHTKIDAEDLFENKIKFAFDNLPDWLKNELIADTDSAKKLVFSNGSSITVGTSLRSGTYQMLLISEYGKVSAKYPDKAREIKTGALNTVEVGQKIIVESTAEGKTGEFFDMCESARKLKAQGKQLTRLEPKFHFYAWFDNPDYRLSDDETENTAVPKETQEYLAKFKFLTKNQIAWYAAKEAIMQDDMRREYPSTPEEAFEGSLEGAYYTKQMELVRKNGGITNCPYDPRFPVRTFWDLGGGHDQFSIIFHQLINNKHKFINYHESNDQGWDFYANLLRSYGYNYFEHYLPHDGVKRIVGKTILTTKELAEQVGIRPIKIVTRTTDVQADIRNKCKPILINCEFDEKNCALLIKRLDNYRRRWDKINSMWVDDAVHDESSHGADSYRTFASVADKIQKIINNQDEKPKSDVYFQRPDELGWMA